MSKCVENSVVSRNPSGSWPFQPATGIGPGGQSGDSRGWLGVDVVRAVPNHRRIGLPRGTTVTGWYPIKPGHPAVAYEGGLERDFLSQIAMLNCVERVESQPVTVFFRCEGHQRRYTPDFFLRLASIPVGLKPLGVVTGCFYVEVKPRRFLLRSVPPLAVKFEAVRQATGLPILLFTDEEIRERGGEVFHE